MKVQIFRSSGRPVIPADIEAYESEWKSMYDLVEKRAEKLFSRLKKTPLMFIQSRMLRVIEANLNRKFGKIVEIDMPKSPKAWQKMVKGYEAPVMVAISAEGAKTVMIIMDELAAQ